MNNNLLLSLAVSVTPILAIGFVSILLLYKVYVKIRSKFSSTVNCWFCNQNTKVPYLESNSWTCPHCEQYNGFTKDGDYNREILQQLDCSASQKLNYLENSSSDLFGSQLSSLPRNGFCNVCNEAQRLKVEKLAQFEPKNESHFDEELKTYQAQLEDQYRLCETCDRHLRKVLREKKKMVLGSKFLDFIIKGAESLKQPHFKRLRQAKRLQWKQRFTFCISLLTLLNVLCLFRSLPTITREHMTHFLGEYVGGALFIVFSHVLVLCRMLASYLESGNQHHLVVKLGLFLRTILMMLLYSMGLKLPQLVRFSFSALYLLASPFAILGLSFGHNSLDGFRLSRYTFLLVLWSFLASGCLIPYMPMAENHLVFFVSLLTLTLSITTRRDTCTKLLDSSTNSFHKIYSEDYLSDDETMSLLSQQLDSSAASVRSHSFNTFRQHSPTKQRLSTAAPASATKQMCFEKSPLTSSTFSLNQSFCLNNRTNSQTLRPNYAASMCDFPTATATDGALAVHPHAARYASNFELHNGGLTNASLFSHPTANNNSSFGLSSYGSSLNMTQRPNNSDEERFVFGARNHNGGTFSTAPTPLHSPFSGSTNTVHSMVQPPRPSSVLTPSHFGPNCFVNSTSGLATNSWLSGGYFNQQRISAHTALPNTALYEHRNGQLTVLEENLSRASSQSSGFESQNGRVLNYSRENSFCPDTADLLQRTNKLVDNRAKTFHSIDARPASLLSPLSVNCNTSSAPSELWGAPLLRKGLQQPRDSFNLRKINEELPTIRRGDLLRKWKESQCIS